MHRPLPKVTIQGLFSGTSRNRSKGMSVFANSQILHPNHCSIYHQFLNDLKKTKARKIQTLLPGGRPKSQVSGPRLGFRMPMLEDCIQTLQRTPAQHGKVLGWRTSPAWPGAFPSQQFPVRPSSSQSSQATARPFQAFTSQENVGASFPSSFRKTQTTWSNTL